ncbi:MAG: hypothetical protein ACTSYX_09035 [Candidatus Thorarchaeota archaeon]
MTSKAGGNHAISDAVERQLRNHRREHDQFYLELQRDYADRFPDETTLLAAAGVCDAAVYVFAEKTISVDDIRGIARDVMEKRSPPNSAALHTVWRNSKAAV